jgi:DNA-binding MarR family transcriptional regulator
MMASQQDSLGFLLANVSRLMRHAFQQQLEGSSLTLAQARALIYVSRNEGVRQVELADLLEVQPMTLARLIDQLAAEGLVERRPDPTDRRACLVFLTAAAARHLLAIKEVTTAVHAEATRGLDDKQTAGVLHALRRMRDNLSSR